MIPDKGKQSVVGDVKGGELGRISFLFELLLGTLLALALASFLLGLTLCSWFVALRRYHYRLQGSSNIILQSGVFVCPPIQFFSVLFYKSFYDLYVMVLIVKPYFKAYGFDLLNHIL